MKIWIVAGALVGVESTGVGASAQGFQERREERREERQERREERGGREEQGGRELLGCRQVGFLADRDVIRVGRREGRFGAIQLEVSENAIFLLDLKVVYGNGVSDDLQVRSEIRAGGRTRAIDLRGRDRFIREIQIVYRARPSFRGRARVCAYGIA